VIAAVLAATVAAAGCSSSSGRAASSTPATSSAASSGPKSTPTDSSTPAVRDIDRVLLAASDISPTATATKARTVDNPLPCAADGSRSLNQQVPAIVRSGIDISDTKLHAAVSEEIRVYQDISTAVHALSVAKDGLTCTAGVIRADDGTKLNVALSGPDDVLTDLKTDAKLAEVPIGSALTWAAHTAHGEQFVLVAAQIDRTLMLMVFYAASIADESNLPDPEVIMEKAIEKANT
jgi:hypothetical protein